MNKSSFNRNLIKRFKSEETGQILILSLIFMLFGSLTLVPLLKLTFTELETSQMYKSRTYDTYACDSAIDDAAQKLIKMSPPLDTLEIGGSYTYTTDTINNRTPEVTITKLSLLTSLLGDEEYKIDQPHLGWLNMSLPVEETVRNYEENWVEYSCNISFNYDGTGDRFIKSIGAYFSPATSANITGPYDEAPIPIITFDNLESVEEKITAGGFAYIYRWIKNEGPVLSASNPTGSLNFKFKVYDADWEPATIFAWATFKEQDVSVIVSSQMVKWLIEASVGDISIRAEVLRDLEGIDILSWELLRNT
jgi:hypothetical protein